jgi:Ca2+-transporting ATPase
MASLKVPADDLQSVNSNTPLAPERYDVSLPSLSALHDPKSLAKLYEIGGFEKLLALLNTSTKGINEDDPHDIRERINHFGKNKLPDKGTKSFLRLCYEAMKDKVLILLSIAAIVSLALGLYETFGQGTVYDDEGIPLPKLDWVEGVAILVAVLIVVIVGAANDYQKERQFAKLNAKKEDRELIVIRNGKQRFVSIYDLMVGDVINLQTGDVIPADSVLFEGELECDESSITGESDTLKKTPVEVALCDYENHLPTKEDLGSHDISFKDPYLISGSTVLAGLGNAVVTAVGENSIHGRTMMGLSQEAETTPLQERLDNLAEGISKYGFLAALLLFIILFIRFCVDIAPGGSLHEANSTKKGKEFLDILIVAITIVVVAVPEGLPLAVTLALAFATTRMAQNGNLVRVLRSCETMGGATAVCSDKTGTLTENRMTVVRGSIGLDEKHAPLEFDDRHVQSGIETLPGSREIIEKIPLNCSVFICTNILLNSTAFENGDYDEEKAQQAREKPKRKPLLMQLFTKSAPQQQQLGNVSEPFLGNKTESALLIFAKKKFKIFEQSSLDEQRKENEGNIVQVIAFESSRKWAGLVMKIDNGYRLYVKGAAEIIFRNCAYEYDCNGDRVKLDRTMRDLNLYKIDEFAGEALRTIALAHRDFEGIDSWPPPEFASENVNSNEADPDLLINTKKGVSEDKQLIMDLLVGIQDPLKRCVDEAVLQCKRAGVTVRMVTGDNLITAKAISKSCNILTPDDLSNEYATMEGPEYRKLSPPERRRITPHLRVLARSSPEDKRVLVDTLKKLGEVVAVTGDGTNDAPALRLADVGFSMGISGTEVAREASDIILMTDDFTDIVQAIKWGRTVAISIKKFIQFQLTVNITACVLTFVSAIASPEGHSVLTAVQLLWVNLIMDTLAALALATDKPDDAFLNRKPAGRTSRLISTSMWKMIIGQACTQLIITFVLYFAGKQIFYGKDYVLSNKQEKQMAAMTFNTFVWLQFWKLIVTRKLDECDEVTTVRGRINRENLDFFQHLFRNFYFLAIALIIGGGQVLIMFVGGASFSIIRQTPAQWATAIICGLISIPAGIIIRIIPNVWVERIFPTRAFNKLLYFASFSFLKRKKKADEKLEEGEGEDDEEVKP